MNVREALDDKGWVEARGAHRHASGARVERSERHWCAYDSQGQLVATCSSLGLAKAAARATDELGFFLPGRLRLVSEGSAEEILALVKKHAPKAWAKAVAS